MGSHPRDLGGGVRDVIQLVFVKPSSCCVQRMCTGWGLRAGDRYEHHIPDRRWPTFDHGGTMEVVRGGQVQDCVGGPEKKSQG